MHEQHVNAQARLFCLLKLHIIFGSYFGVNQVHRQGRFKGVQTNPPFRMTKIIYKLCHHSKSITCGERIVLACELYNKYY